TPLQPGSSHAILKTLPLLDSLQEDSQKLTATDLFAFQGSHTRSSPKISLPDVIQNWPSLDSDPTVASMSSGVKPADSSNGHLDVPDDANVDSILVVTDNAGCAHFFLDGSYNLGPVHLGVNISSPSLAKLSQDPTFIIHVQEAVNNVQRTKLYPLYVQLPMLKERDVRDMARLSTSSRELVWYCMRVVKEMRLAWFGAENISGAREIGPQWVRAFENRQVDQFGQQEPTAILDLTYLLLTRRGSESLTDFLGSGEQMSERGIQKWESSMTEALVKLRDFSEKRVAPACQRLHLVLEEVLGWSSLPQYAPFQLQTAEVKTCLELAGRAIFIATWLAAIARRELLRFKEFITWLRDAISSTTSTGDFQYQHRHDTLEVNNYLTAGLVVSSLDKWFMGPVPQFNPQDFGVLAGTPDLRSALEQAYTPIDPAAWHQTTSQNELNHLDRNLDALVQELALRCQRVFERAAGATSHHASVLGQDSQATQARPPQITVRERLIPEVRLEAYVAPAQGTTVCLARVRFDGNTSHRPSVSVALLDGTLPAEQEEAGGAHLNIVNVGFFDDLSLVIVYRDSAFIATVGYNELYYQELDPEAYVKPPTREDLMQRAMELWEHGQVGFKSSVIGHALISCAAGRSPDPVQGTTRTGARGGVTGIERTNATHPAAAPSWLSSSLLLRKQKNAAAQAAFRARRANYIATLEETVTSLESVVLQLQDSVRDSRLEVQELRQQNANLRHEFREREKFWRALWQSRTGKTNENDSELPPAQPNLIGPLHSYSPEAITYRSADDPTICQYGAGPSQGYNSPAISYESSPHSLTQRGAKYSPYGYPVPHRDHSWTASSGGESGQSPTLTASSELSLPFSAARFGEEQKVAVNALDAAPYVFSNSRPSTPATPFPFPFTEGSVHDRAAEFDFHRRASHSGEVSLSGPGSDAVRYRLGARRAVSSVLPILPPLAASESGSPHDHASSDGDSSSYPRLRTRRDSAISRSSSPSSATPLSGTLAVIKAQAFGALRRTRARNKKPIGASGKAAGGMQMGAPSANKRPRTEEGELQT
ncbi:anaphase-promoting complex, cyclosome, subunit 4-domain-containing protein, partial [Mycena amicta]